MINEYVGRTHHRALRARTPPPLSSSGLGSAGSSWVQLRTATMLTIIYAIIIPGSLISARSDTDI